MKLILTANDGTVLDTATISADEFRQEVRLSPHGFLASLAPGSAALAADRTPAFEDREDEA